MTTTPDVEFTLADRYSSTEGEVLVTGIQALARVPIDQMRADRMAGLNTRAFVSGYQGSPLGGYDRELLAHRKLLDEYGILHWPGTNEELAATAVSGSQLATNQRTANVDGVAGYWYGKAPGLERALDAIRHGLFAGAAPKGGVLAMIGDDPACKSSTVPSRSDALVAALGMPLLDPGTMQDVLDMGRHGIELSRLSGMWCGLKIVTAVADGSGLASVEPGRLHPVRPQLEIDGKPWSPMLSAFTLSPVSLSQEAEQFGPRIEMALRYIQANNLNHEIISSPTAWLTIISSGYTLQCVLDALAMLGVDPQRASELGIRVLQLGAIHPFDVDAVRAACRGVGTVLVVEEKRAFIETLVRDALYPTADRPVVVGKCDSDGKRLVPDSGALSSESVAEPLRRVLLRQIGEENLAPLRRRTSLILTVKPEAVRTAYFCSGCPHNTSTVVPEGSLVGIGIGCHGMVGGLHHEHRGEFTGICQMGGEGLHWVGMSPFVDTPHLFQNLGDGTYFHSGQLAVQAAISAGVNITYKILYNSAVAMTGGQDATGQLPVPQLAQKLLLEGVKEVVVTTDEPERYRKIQLPQGITVRHRDDIVKVQEHLRTIPGVTVLIHDQQCAAEKRRDRKRGILPTPTTRVIIDHRVCEGCGDCGVQSNCLSLEPFDTDWGRKTRIDQASCNLDRSCIKGDCPAFVTVVPAPKTKRKTVSSDTPLPRPNVVVPADMTIRMPGIGGTGVVTVSQLLLAAAKIDGLRASAIDQTGLSQKAGPVVSTVTVGDPVPGQVHLLLGFDLLASVTQANLDGMDPAWSHAVASSTITPTGRMIGNVASAGVDLPAYRTELDARSNSQGNRYPEAGRLCVGLLGSGVTANVLLLGVAYQAGMLPMSAEAIERAIELNGAAVEANKAAFAWGRRWVVDPKGVEQIAFAGVEKPSDTTGLDGLQWPELIALVARRRHDLRAYQSRSYADGYVTRMLSVAAAEQAVGGDGSFSRTVAHQLARLMAYKDEYEVARLLTSGTSRAEQALGGPVQSVTWNLHPPVLKAFGLEHKLKLGGWTRPGMRGLAALKGLRGTPLDPFGRMDMRKTERLLVKEYETLIDRLVPMLATNHADAVRIATLVDQVRGYEDVKLRNLAAYRKALAEALRAVQ
jgi:indolepyruvate ferredoxin oxidoreductase